jgi:dehydrogenase/reductase SDR family protein 12
LLQHDRIVLSFINFVNVEEEMTWNRLLDHSIIFSFDRSGFLRHLGEKSLELKTAKTGLKALITGASRGIGKALSTKLETCGIQVYGLSRSQPEGESVFQVDMGNLRQISQFVKRPDLPSFDILVHSAGSMPLSKMTTEQGLEEIFASQVVGPYCLTRGLIESGKASKGMRTIFVSSGGLYFRKFSFEEGPYQRHAVYANAKRAQLLLVHLLQEQYGAQGFTFSAMHPGWVDTEGVAHSMPWFYRFMKGRFRTPDQGADTIAWLALTESTYPGGKFWFDRMEAPEHYFAYTQESQQDERDLLGYCERYYEEYFR